MAEKAEKSARLRVLRDKVGAKAERMANSDTMLAVRSGVADGLKGLAEGCGFLAWEAGRLIAPLKERLKRQIEKYKEEHGD